MCLVVGECCWIRQSFFFFGDEFSQPGDQKKKKRTGESNKGIFEIFKENFAIS
jgi:hypothetical protein